MGYICPVCGYPELEEPAYQGDLGCLEMCPSCGFQFGVDDDDRNISHEEWRARWITKGTPWFSSGYIQPENWDPKQQLENLLQRR